MKVKEQINALIIYSLLFPLLWLGIYYPFFQAGKNYIWLGDGMDQHFPALYYLGNYYKEILPLLFRGQFSSIPMVDFSIGMGFDILTTLSYYGLGDPLLLLTVFWQPEAMESAYNWIIIFRSYLTGISFLIYCFYMRLDRRGIIIGAFIYVFCGFGVYAAVRHPFFCIPMVYFPVILIGIERMLDSDGKNGLFLSFIIALAVISNFYFFYMITLLAFFYGVVRYFDMKARPNLKRVMKTFLLSIFHYFLGLCLAGIFLLPILTAYLNNARLQTLSFTQSSTYEWSYYLKSIYNLFTPIILDDFWSILSLTPLALITLFLLFRQRHRYLSLKILTLLDILLLCLPIGGSLMNGMGYASNRWVWGFAFLIAINCVLLFDKILNDTPFTLIFSTLLGLSALTFFYSIIQDIRIYIGLFLSILLLFIISYYRSRENKQFGILLIAAITSVSLILNGLFLYLINGDNYLNQFGNQGQAFYQAMSSPVAQHNDIQDDGMYRVSLPLYVDCINQALILGYRGTNSYYSITSRYFAEYCQSLELRHFLSHCRMDGFDKRSVLETLASVKYFYATEYQEAHIPYGFKEIGRSTEAELSSVFYENNHWLPLGYTYDSYFTGDDAMKMNGLELQQGMAQAILLQEEPALSIYKTAIKSTVQAIPYQFSKNSSSLYSAADNALIVSEAGDSLELSFEIMSPGEIYIRLQGLNIDDSGHESLTITCKDFAGNGDGYVYAHSRESISYCMEDFLIHLGYREAGQMKYTLAFNKSGHFQLEALEVYFADVETTASYITNLKEESLYNVASSPNQITANLYTSADKILCFSIPYSQGWKAYIDGVQTPVYRANLMYMAVEVEPGSHDVRLQYQTPSLKEGRILSASALLYTAFIWGCRKVKKRS